MFVNNVDKKCELSDARKENECSFRNNVALLFQARPPEVKRQTTKGNVPIVTISNIIIYDGPLT